MRFAYADPPYLGQGRHYRGHAEASDWDGLDEHKHLIETLTECWPDGWALSLSSPSLGTLLPLCPADVRVAAWVKPFCAFKRGVRPAYAWEPVIFRGGRNTKHPPPEKGGKATTPKDFVSANITLKRGLTGAKPAEFCSWLLDLLNVQPADVVDDLFPGSGALATAAAGRAILGPQTWNLIRGHDVDHLSDYPRDGSCSHWDPLAGYCRTRETRRYLIGSRCRLDAPGATAEHCAHRVPWGQECQACIDIWSTEGTVKA